MNIRAEENDAVTAEVMNLLEVEPACLPVTAPGPDIPALREQLSILVSTGKCKETIGVNLTHEQVRRLEDKEVMKHYKRYETSVGAKTTETLIESFLPFSTKALIMLVRLKDFEVLRNELRNDYIITKRAVQSVWQPCAKMWPHACSCQRVFDNSKTCRFQR